MAKKPARVRWLVILLVAAVPGIDSPAAHADVTAVTGNAYGYFSDTTIFGTTTVNGPSPSVTLAPDASNSPLSASAPSGSAQHGPASLFSSGAITVSTSGTLGPGGFAKSSSTVNDLNTSGTESLNADKIVAKCSASEDGAAGATTITEGSLILDGGLDLNDDGDFTDNGEHPPAERDLPRNPAQDKVFDGHLHVNGTTERFRFIVNEHTVDENDSLSINGVHQLFLGPTVSGELVIAHVACGVSGTGPTCLGQPATILGTNGHETLEGTSGPDVIVGLGGNDTVLGGGGRDRICGNPGNDTLNGGGKGDELLGGDGGDDLGGGGGGDRIVGGAGPDDLLGGKGGDFLDARDGISGNDTLNGQGGSNECRADSGDIRQNCGS